MGALAGDLGPEVVELCDQTPDWLEELGLENAPRDSAFGRNCVVDNKVVEGFCNLNLVVRLITVAESIIRNL